MTTKLDLTILIKGAGEFGSAVAHRMSRSHFRVCLTEIPKPLAINRGVAFSEAIYDGEKEIEGVTAKLVSSPDDIFEVWNENKVPILVDPLGEIKEFFHPQVLVDTRMAKRNLGTQISYAPLVIGLGPGFRAGVDVHIVVETNRNDNLGRIILEGEAEKDTGIPVAIGGYTYARVLRAPGDGILTPTKEIGTVVSSGEVVGFVGDKPIQARIGGVLRGLLRSVSEVREGTKVGEIDPLCAPEDCRRVRAIPRAIAGAVLEAILSHFNQARGRVFLKSSFRLGKEVVELEEGMTLRSLLQELSSKVPVLEPERLVNWGVVISLNGQECELLPLGLDTPLSPDDEVEIAPAGFGGG